MRMDEPELSINSHVVTCIISTHIWKKNNLGIREESTIRAYSQSELPRRIPHFRGIRPRITSRIYFDNAGDNVTLTL